MVEPETIGTGAIQVLFPGRLARPETTLLWDELAAELFDVGDETTIEEAIDEEDGLLPPPPPPQHNNIKLLAIKIIIFTQICMFHSSSKNNRYAIFNATDTRFLRMTIMRRPTRQKHPKHHRNKNASTLLAIVGLTA